MSTRVACLSPACRLPIVQANRVARLPVKGAVNEHGRPLAIAQRTRDRFLYTDRAR
ncbi:unnamed protein product (plasmid) [Mycetohabitans rhizoxinica HKI 454]|uniref:Uncharacterized protein n=1 Tax=Mycetohabitans rhizoxinica (strain DSM 19002 / CIP 109453 / HKI 454) TaxID=882378 RepID=E5AU48_MYCRK|nr:unnamed protein product [Mycetohabitans rhizoxinica HKI 454]